MPLALRGRLPKIWLGWANAVAAGLMLGIAYALLTAGVGLAPVAASIGAMVGMGSVLFAHVASGTGDMELNRIEGGGAAYGYQVLLVNALHAAHEGVAIGVAMAVEIPFGILMAVAIGVHNVPEAVIQSAILNGRGVRLRDAAGLAVATNANQVLLAVVVFAIVGAAPAALPWLLGFAVGALVFLVAAELLPESYQEAGRTSIAVLTVVAVGVVVMLAGPPG